MDTCSSDLDPTHLLSSSSSLQRSYLISKFHHNISLITKGIQHKQFFLNIFCNSDLYHIKVELKLYLTTVYQILFKYVKPFMRNHPEASFSIFSNSDLDSTRPIFKTKFRLHRRYLYSNCHQNISFRTKLLSIYSFSIFSNSDLDPTGPTFNPKLS